MQFCHSELTGEKAGGEVIRVGEEGTSAKGLGVSSKASQGSTYRLHSPHLFH